jgi:oligoribonuclease
MKYVSIDIETTGIDREKCEILSIGAVIEDTSNPNPIEELPRFHAAIRRRDRQGFYGEPVALTMNAGLIALISQYEQCENQDEKNDLVQLTGIQFLEENEIAIEFYYWLFSNGAFEFDIQKLFNGHSKKHPLYGTVPVIGSNPQKAYLNVAGKNFATFDKIFLEKLPRWKQLIDVRNRILDPAILFVDWNEDKSLPGLDKCKQRAGIDGIVTHNALEDAIDVVEILRTKYSNS